MGSLIRKLTPSGRWLVVTAAAAELRAVLRGAGAEHEAPPAMLWTPIRCDGFDVVQSGVGKANAAGATAATLSRGRYAGVLSVGIAGWLGADSSSSGAEDPVGRIIIATSSVYADEGVETDDKFIALDELGFAPGSGMPGTDGMGVRCDEGTLEVFRATCDASGVIATVSTCSGTDARAQSVRVRTGAIAEAMEGAAVGFTVKRLSPTMPFAEVRIISNRTGRRSQQGWDLPRALARLSEFASLL